MRSEAGYLVGYNSPAQFRAASISDILVMRRQRTGGGGLEEM